MDRYVKTLCRIAACEQYGNIGERNESKPNREFINKIER